MILVNGGQYGFRSMVTMDLGQRFFDTMDLGQWSKKDSMDLGQ